MEIKLEATSGTRFSLALSDLTITIKCKQPHSLLEVSLETIGGYPEAALLKKAGFFSMLAGNIVKQPQGEVSFDTSTGLVLSIAHDGEYVRVSTQDGAELAFYDAVELSGTENAHLVWSELLQLLKGGVSDGTATTV